MACYLDDILIAAPTVEEHDVLLVKVLQRLQDCGIHLREEKCQFSQEQVEYPGYLIDTTGVHPTRAIKEAPTGNRQLARHVKHDPLLIEILLVPLTPHRGACYT